VTLDNQTENFLTLEKKNVVARENKNTNDKFIRTCLNGCGVEKY
jgi:hypothetical protein